MRISEKVFSSFEYFLNNNFKDKQRQPVLLLNNYENENEFKKTLE